MKCTKCSEVVKPIVALDIDGTLGDYHGHFLRFAVAYLGLSRSPTHYRDGTPAVPYTGQCKFRHWFCDLYDVSDKTWEDIKLAYRQGAQKRSMPADRDAAPLATWLRSAGAELWLTTTRPYQRLDNVDPDTRAWLKLHGIRYDYMLYDEQKYELLAGIVDPARVVAILEDEEGQYGTASSVFGPEVPILRRQRYNLAFSNPRTEVTNLVEARQLMEIRIAKWNGEQS